MGTTTDTTEDTTAATPEERSFYVVNLSHLNREHKYVTFWRPDDCGYAFPLSWAGRYPESVVREHLRYYNRGDNIAVPCSVVEALAVDPAKGDIDNDAGPVVLSNRDNWKVLLANVIETPPSPLVPVYKGARGKSVYAYSASAHPKRNARKSQRAGVHD